MRSAMRSPRIHRARCRRRRRIDAAGGACAHVAAGNARRRSTPACRRRDGRAPGQTRIAGRPGRHAPTGWRTRARRLRPPRAWRSASRQSLPLAGPAGAVRCAGIRRGDGDHRPRLRPRLPADGPRPAGRPRGGQPRAEPLRRAHRRRRADARPAGVPVAARDDPRACRGEARQRTTAARYLGARRGVSAARAAGVVAIGGLPGTGKSTLARALAPELGSAPGALVLRSDEIRKRQHGVAPEQRLPQAAYSDAASEAVFAELAELARDDRGGRPRGDRGCDLHRSAPPRTGGSSGTGGRRAVSSACGWRRRCRCWRRASQRGGAMPRMRRSRAARRGARNPQPGDWIAVDASATPARLSRRHASASTSA